MLPIFSFLYPYRQWTGGVWVFSCMNCSREPHLLLLMARKIVSLRFLSKYNMWLTVSIDASNYDSVTQRNDLQVTTAY